jgi:hypothetical protein
MKFEAISCDGGPLEGSQTSLRRLDSESYVWQAAFERCP